MLFWPLRVTDVQRPLDIPSSWAFTTTPNGDQLRTILCPPLSRHRPKSLAPRGKNRSKRLTKAVPPSSVLRGSGSSQVSIVDGSNAAVPRSAGGAGALPSAFAATAGESRSCLRVFISLHLMLCGSSRSGVVPLLPSAKLRPVPGSGEAGKQSNSENSNPAATSLFYIML